MQEDLHLKEGELQKAQSTSMSLTGGTYILTYNFAMC